MQSSKPDITRLGLQQLLDVKVLPIEPGTNNNNEHDQDTNNVHIFKWDVELVPTLDKLNE
jgi:hypothetical protein